MPKGQQRGNKEAKKPKKGKPAPSASIPAVVMPVSNGGSNERPKKK
jgi:hypothetical protein